VSTTEAEETKEDGMGLCLTKAIKRDRPAAARKTSPTLHDLAETRGIDARWQGPAAPIALTDPSKQAESA
jgi:hypothetical protein